MKKLNWRQSTNVKVGDIVYIYLSAPSQSIQYKCIVNEVDLNKIEIDDRHYYLDEKLKTDQGRYMELELIDKYTSSAFYLKQLKNHGFIVPQGPMKLKASMIKYLQILENLRNTKEMDPDSHDGSYELVKETVNAYSNMDDLTICDYNDLNLVYLMSIGTWRHGIARKREAIERSNLPIAEKERLNEVLSRIFNNAKQKRYSNHKGTKPLIGMFGTGFYTFSTKTDNESVSRFIKL